MSGVNIQAWTLCLFYIFVENKFKLIQHMYRTTYFNEKIQKLQNVIAPKLQNIKQKMLPLFFLGRYKDAHAEGFW